MHKLIPIVERIKDFGHVVKLEKHKALKMPHIRNAAGSNPAMPTKILRPSKVVPVRVPSLVPPLVC